ncbi:MAG: helix-turn-helix domain-containing protein [Kofleriaceae bacterium]
MFQQRRAAKRRRVRAPAPTATREITSAAAVEALAYPLRQELLDTLQAFGGEAAALELAEHLGHPVDGLYYHLRLLVQHGLVAERRLRNAAGRLERRFRISAPGEGPLRLAYQPRRARHADALRKVVAGMLRIAGRDFERALDEDGVVIDGPRRELWAGRAKGWLSDEELEELNQLLARLLALLEQPRRGSRRHLMSFCFAMAPVSARPKRRGGEEEATEDRRESGPSRKDRAPRRQPSRARAARASRR